MDVTGRCWVLDCRGSSLAHRNMLAKEGPALWNCKRFYIKLSDKNYLGVALQTGFQPKLREMKIGNLPWTDRIFCETLPLIDESLQAPWSTIEFDSAFMTLHRERDPQTQQPKVAGVMGRIVNQERLFAKSLAQFYLTRENGPL